MPYRPDFSSHTPSPAVASYQKRVGRLSRDGHEVGYVLVLIQAYAEVIGGHLWWRRWGVPEDALSLWTIIDGQFSDSWVPESALGDELADYEAGRFAFYGEALQVVWADDEESARLRRQHFERVGAS